MLPRQNSSENLTSLLVALKIFFSVNKQITNITILISTQEKLCIYFTKINTLPFFDAPKLPLVSKVSPLPNSKKSF